MDFISSGENAIIHVLRREPFELLTGTLKSKTQQPQANPYAPNPQPQTTDIVITINGNDELIPGLQAGMDTVEYKGGYYSTTNEGIKQCIANVMQMATEGIAKQSYYQDVLVKGNGYMEQLDPQYAESRRQAREIAELKARSAETDKNIADIKAMMEQFLAGEKKSSKK